MRTAFSIGKQGPSAFKVTIKNNGTLLLAFPRWWVLVTCLKHNKSWTLENDKKKHSVRFSVPSLLERDPKSILSAMARQKHRRYFLHIKLDHDTCKGLWAVDTRREANREVTLWQVRRGERSFSHSRHVSK